MRNMFTDHLTKVWTPEGPRTCATAEEGKKLSYRNHFLWVEFTNWHGKRAWRRVIPYEIRCEVLPSLHASDPQWFLLVLMEDRDWAIRSILMSSIHEIKPGGPSPLSYGNDLPIPPERPTPP